MSKLAIIKGDITEVEVDAIVNSSNTNLLGYANGNGVTATILKKGGGDILKACKQVIIKKGSLLPGEAVLTTAGKLQAKKIIHTVGPIWNDGQSQEEILLTNCYDNALQLAVEHGLSSIAFPNISTGFYKFPIEIAAEIAIGTCQWFLKKEEGKILQKVLIVCHNEANYKQCMLALEKSKH
ncbi:macro domain-containing protein [Chondrinema litorale]|uniref:macro domain-containing protein n=1 Tax=Chondrinema litorale TaxID=2994555 RepID=UPI0025436794|nr:macro domain-containing protein [Chondrinema litorale]UZR99796.1 macro domain-containing protein [Chondrinema litorale]